MRMSGKRVIYLQSCYYLYKHNTNTYETYASIVQHVLHIKQAKCILVPFYKNGFRTEIVNK